MVLARAFDQSSFARGAHEYVSRETDPASYVGPVPGVNNRRKIHVIL
jgi:hypothetical protein